MFREQRKTASGNAKPAQEGVKVRTKANKGEGAVTTWLVLAAQYPSLNQPWLETYLTNLRKHRVQPIIVSCNERGVALEVEGNGFMNGNRVLVVQASRLRTIVAAVRTAAKSWEQSVRITRAVAETTNVRSLRELFGSVCRSLEAFGVLGENSPDGVHAHSLALAASFVYPAGALGVPLVVTYHGQEPRDVPQIPRYLVELVFNNADIVLVNTHYAAKQAHALGCPMDKTRIIPQGIPLNNFGPGNQWRNRVHQQVQLLSVGRLVREKGHHHALSVVTELRRRGVLAHLTIIGDGPERSALSAAILENGLDACVTLLGAQESKVVQRMLQQAEFLLLFSSGARHPTEWTETQGVVVQEAQASGCIPIAYAVGGVPEGIASGIDGYLVDEGDWMQAVEIVCRLNSSPEIAVEIVDRASQTVAERYDAEKIGDKMATLLSLSTDSSPPDL